MNVKAVALFSLLVVLAACSQGTTKPPAKAEFLNSPAALQRNLPFSEAVRAGDLLFLAGQMGTDPATGQLVPGGLEPEARQAIENMKSVLEHNGRSLTDLVEVHGISGRHRRMGEIQRDLQGIFQSRLIRPVAHSVSTAWLAVDA